MDENRFTTEGYKHASESLGDINVLKFNLARIKSEYEAEIKKKNEGQKTDISSLKTKIKEKRDQIEDLKKDSEERKRQINDIGNDDETIEKKSKKINSRIPFGIAIVIMIPLTIFLWLFYANAIHSLYIRDLQNESNQVERSAGNKPSETGVALINPNLFAQIFVKGVSPDSVFIFIIVAFSPSIFLGAGFLVHAFKDSEVTFKNSEIKKGLFWLILVYTFTLAFDCVIAHDLVEKVQIYTVGQSGAKAAEKLSYWIQFAKILFTSFAVYLMWGLIFNYIIQNHKILRVERQKLSSKERQLNEINSKISKLQEQINNFEGRIEFLKRQIPMDFAELKHRLHRYTSGWSSAIHKSRDSNEDFKPLTELLESIEQSGKYYSVEDSSNDHNKNNNSSKDNNSKENNQ